MGPKHISKTALQALEWLKKMGIEATAELGGEMYEFEYKDTLMFITVDIEKNLLFITAPVYLTGQSDERNKEIFDIAEYMTHEELKDYIVEYVSGHLSYVGQIYPRPPYGKLRRYQLISALDQIADLYETFFCATAIASAPLEEWFKDEELNDE